MLSDFYKENETDQIWWLFDTEKRGEFLFSFDKKRIFNFFRDYPQELTEQQRLIFEKENPELAKLK